MGQSSPLLEIQSLTKRFGSVTALREVSFSVRPGEILGLIGPNGSGKTTLFECLGGILPSDSGAIVQDSHPLSHTQRSQLLFYLPDGIAPWPAQTVAWVLDYCLGFFKGRAELLSTVIERLELRPLLNQRIGSLSKGQRKRALLGFGLLTPHPLFVADEPFDGLDLRQVREVAETLRGFAAGGKRTMLLSIHQISDAARVCDRFVLLSNGQIAGQGTLPELAALTAARGRIADRSSLEEVFLALT